MAHSAAGYTLWDASVTTQKYKFPPTVGLGISGSNPGFPYVVAILYQHPDGFESPFGTVQGTRVSDSDGWTTPDAYAGNIHDPMSQKPYMWNRNNPYTYNDPTGFDTIEMVYRRVWEAIPNEYHSYIKVTSDNGKVTQYSFGPGNNNALVWKPGNQYDDPKIHPPRYSRPIANCKGTCTMSNGGFNEGALPRLAKEIDQLKGHYDGPNGPNSNSAATTLCADAGGSNCVIKLGPFESAPGATTVIPLSGQQPHPNPIPN